MNNPIVVLTLKSQKNPGEKVFKLHKKRIVFGSAPSSDIRLEDAQISSIHAILEISGADGKPVIYDLASDSGLKVNGNPTVQATLNVNDQISIGPYIITVKLQSTQDAADVKNRVQESFGQKLFISEKEDLSPLILSNEADVIEIFDRRSEMESSLQIVMFYKETILDVEHFVHQKRVVIGPRSKDDFCIPPFLGDGKSGKFELISKEGSQFYLHLHDKMNGVLNKDGRLVPVKEYTSSLTTASSKSVPLLLKDFAKVSFGDVSFFMNYTPAPPVLKYSKPFKQDPVFFKIWLFSLLMTCLMIFTLHSVSVTPTIEIEQLPERVATILFEVPIPPMKRPKVQTSEESHEAKPVKKAVVKEVKVTKKEPAKEIKLGKNEQHQQQHKKPAQHLSGQEGAGARAKGEEGRRGKTDAKKSNVAQEKAVRPGVGPKSNAAATNKGRSETDDLGIVDLFKSDKGTVSKILAGGKGVSQAASKLEGYSGFTTKGEGGLGAEGAGKGGGGESLGLGGLADHGPGGGKKGSGLGALGSGGNLLGGSGKISVESVGMPEPIVLGAIDTDAIAREIAKHRDEIKYCYEKEINAERPDLAGRIGIRFVIGASGTVTTAGLSSSSLKHPNTEICVINVIKRIQFPPIRGGGVAEVTYPFVFKPATK